MKAELGWECLSDRRHKQRLKFLYLIYYNKTGINRDIYLHKPHYTSQRCDHSCKILEYPAKTNMYANSFFPRTIKQWNRLTEKQVHSGNEEVFYSML
uniref:Endonuclease/reverse transcript n=1 Tax=Rhipicephalus appendiculatus TaxID=34631 RepID=A0A131YTD7_RHIAP